MDTSYVPGYSCQKPSDYLPEWLDPAVFGINPEETASRSQFAPAGGRTSSRSGEPDTRNPDVFHPAPQGQGSNYFQPADLQVPVDEPPWFSSHGHDQPLHDNIAIRIPHDSHASLGITADHGVASGATPASPLSHSKPISIPSKYPGAYHLDGYIPDLSTELVPSEPSRDFSVLPPASHEILSPNIEQSTSAPEWTTDNRPTNGYLSPSKIHGVPVSSYSLSSSPLGGSALSSGIEGGASWAREIIWDSKSGNEVQARGVKRRTEEEKESNAKLRALGGACQECRRRHRKCNHRSGNLARFKERQLPSFTASKSSETRNPSSENLTYSLSSRTSSLLHVSQLNICQNGSPWATDQPIAQGRDTAFDTFAIDDIRNMGFQFRSGQSPIPPLNVEGDDFPEMVDATQGRLPQRQSNAVQPQEQYPPSVRVGHNAGLGDSQSFSNLPGYN